MDDHLRTIIHIDIDCFYAQVEMIKNPALAQKPLGIQQKNIVVTSNYIAREFGVKKCMFVSEAKKLCPQIVLVNGEDLHDYRQVSYKVTELLQSYSELIERLGLDENFIDVSNLVNIRLNSLKNENQPVGYQFGSDNILCDCGCTERISIGTNIAQEIRRRIFAELKLTTCAGVAHNKLLAKIVGSKNKPNKQSFVFPNSASELILSLEFVQKVPWIGASTAEQLKQIGIESIKDLQNSSIQQIENIVGKERAENLLNLSFGVDNAPVKRTGKPQSIGLEDSCKAITVEKEIQEKLQQLLTRLLILVEEDGRIPKTIRLTIRKLDPSHPQNGTRETRQCNINTSLFINKNSQRNEKLMDVIMMLFKKVVNTKHKFHITLLGLAFTKFVERPNMKNTLTNFFLKDMEVQTFTSIENKFEEPITPPKKLSPDNSLSPEIPSKRFKFNEPEMHKNDDLEEIMCPEDVDKEVFKALPRDLQEELWNDYKRKKDLKKPNGKSKSNSILNYFRKEPQLK